MRIIIRHRKTKRYCKTAGTWTDHESQALAFPNALNAFNFAAEAQLGDVEIIFRTRDEPSAVIQQRYGPISVSTPRYLSR